MRRGELARAAGCHIETIRYYEQQGLLAAAGRTASGHRFYGPEELRRLRFILRCRELGFALREIRGLLALVDSGNWSCEEIRRQTERQLAGVRRRLADLQRMEARLASLVAACDATHAPDCAILEMLFEEPQPGPRS